MCPFSGGSATAGHIRRSRIEDRLIGRPGRISPGSWHQTHRTFRGDRLVLSVAEAGALLGLSRAFAYELVARGELPVVRFGRRIVVPKAALLELLSSTPSGR